METETGLETGTQRETEAETETQRERETETDRDTERETGDERRGGRGGREEEGGGKEGKEPLRAEFHQTPNRGPARAARRADNSPAVSLADQPLWPSPARRPGWTRTAAASLQTLGGPVAEGQLTPSSHEVAVRAWWGGLAAQMALCPR